MDLNRAKMGDNSQSKWTSGGGSIMLGTPIPLSTMNCIFFFICKSKKYLQQSTETAATWRTIPMAKIPYIIAIRSEDFFLSLSVSSNSTTGIIKNGRITRRYRGPHDQSPCQ